jgi:ribosomal protein RSM22 (predicted rRNA methylase)
MKFWLSMLKRFNLVFAFILILSSNIFADDYQIKSEDIRVNISNFLKNLSSSDTNVQKALETLDKLNIPDYYSWSVIAETSQVLATGNAYIFNNSSLITATLPTTAAVGDRFYIVGRGSGGWKIAQNSGQIIYIGAKNTTTGSGGYLASTNNRDVVELICVSANAEFQVISVYGNLIVN